MFFATSNCFDSDFSSLSEALTLAEGLQTFRSVRSGEIRICAFRRPSEVRYCRFVASLRIFDVRFDVKFVGDSR
jgi:hypothetical protein